MTTDKLNLIKKSITDGRMVARAGGISVAVEQSDKLGFDWNVYAVNDVVVRKDYVEQAIKVGTADSPIIWEDGMTAYPNFHYVRDGVRKVWTGENSEMPSWDDERFVVF